MLDAGYGEQMTLPPVHEVSGLAAMRQIRASQVGFFASTYQPGRDVVRIRVGPPGLGVEGYLTHSPEAAEKLLSAKSYAQFPKENRVYRQIRLLMGDGATFIGKARINSNGKTPPPTK